MKVAIVGFDTEGRVSYEHFKAQNAEITICDQNQDVVVPDGASSQLGETYLDNLDRFDVIVRTPGLYPGKILAKNPGVADKITSQTNIFFKHCPTKNIIGVTGTKGKGTTSTLITKMLEQAGKDVHLGGNIGTPPMTFLDKLTAESWVVLELSSYQLMDLRYSPHIAVCLLVEPEHLDWHEDVEEYIAAKQQLFINQNSDDVAIYYPKSENSESIADASEGTQIPYFQSPGAEVINDTIVIDGNTICKTDDLKLLGKHNWQNVCAATTAVWQVTQDINAIRSALTSFSGLPFRIEFRKEVGGIGFYNDSFASQPTATIAAVNAIPEPKVMIVGGYERGLDLQLLAETLQKEQSVKHLVVIGESGPRLVAALEKVNCTKFTLSTAKTMPEIIKKALDHAESGDAIVLSPGFASYDLFKNFEDRGNKFNEAVEAL